MSKFPTMKPSDFLPYTGERIVVLLADGLGFTAAAGTLACVFGGQSELRLFVEGATVPFLPVYIDEVVAFRSASDDYAPRWVSEIANFDSVDASDLINGDFPIEAIVDGSRHAPPAYVHEYSEPF